MARPVGRILAVAAAMIVAVAAWLLLREGEPAAPELPRQAAPVVEPPRPVVPEAGFLTGRVLDAKTGAGIRGASVSFSMLESLGGSGSGFIQGESGADGGFRIPDPGGRPVLVLASSPEHLDGRWPIGGGKPDSLPPGGPFELALRPARRIRGTVLDERGAPIPGAHVQLAQAAPKGGGRIGSVTPVRPDGTFVLSGASPGPAMVKASAPGWCQPGFPAGLESLFANGDSLSGPCSVVVPESGEAEIAIVLRRGGTVSGVLVDAEGRPRGGIPLALMVRGGLPRSSVVTREDGAFAFHGVSAEMGLFVTPLAAAGVATGAPTFDLPEGGSVEGLRVVLPRARSVHGVVLDGTGRPAAGAKVRVLPGSGEAHWQFGPRGDPGPSATAGADGGFRVLDLADAAAQVVLVDHSGHARGEREIVGLQEGEDRGPLEIRLVPESPIRGEVVDDEGRPVAGAGIRAGPIRDAQTNLLYALRDGAGGTVSATSDSDGRFVVAGLAAGRRAVGASAPGLLTAAEAVEGDRVRLTLVRPREIEGFVREADTGRPVAGVRVDAHAEDSSKGPSYGHGVTDAEGRFRIAGLRHGSHQVSLQVPAPWLAQGPAGARAESGATRVDFELKRGTSLAGRVLDQDGKPLSYGNLSMGPAGGKLDSRYSIQYGEDGSFRFPAVPAGRYRIVAYPKDWRRRQERTGGLLPAEVSDVEAGREDVEIRLAAGVDLRGSIRDDTGKADFSRLGVALIPPGTGKPDEEEVRREKVNPDGSFLFGGVDPRTARDLALQGRGQGVGGVLRGVTPGGPPVVLPLESGLAIAGRVVDEGGQPVQGIELRAVAVDARGLEDGVRAKTNSKSRFVPTLDVFPIPEEDPKSAALALGEFVLEGLGRFRYRITARTSGSEWAPLTLEADAGTAQPLEFRLGPGATLEGRVLGAPGRRLYVFADPVDGDDDRISYSSVRVDGTFVIRGLAPGPHRLRVNFHSSNEGAKRFGPFEAPATGVEVRWE
jgi:protocatechuate 3,4-dioxygenase beta subunit